MDRDRFEMLADAYGGDLRRWPLAERPAAEAFRVMAPAVADAILVSADGLDEALDAWRVDAPSPALRAAVIAAAPKPRARPAGIRIGLWLSGLGLAASAVAGVVVGVAASNAAVADLRADAFLAQTLAEDVASQSPYTLGTLARPSA